MEQLADETLRLIFSYLTNPDSLSKVSKRLNEVSKDPYTRSQFFLVNHGATHAFWAALCRSACLTEDVISILHSSGAHISRYLTQMVNHAYNRGSRVSACPSRWAQHPKLSFHVYAHFMKLSAALYKELDPNKNEDDGTKFLAWIRQKQGHKSAREKEITWDFIESMFKDYGFIPFAPKDHILTSFPAALALDHRILPLAKKNGLSFDEGFRDFVFRQVFESTRENVDAVPGQRAIAISNAVKELIEIDDELFVSKNVVGEILMEIGTRKAAFESLKVLDDEGHLRFGLGEGVRELIKTFRSTRSITTKGETIQELFRSFPTEDAIVREIVITTVFLEDKDVDTTLENLESLELLPLTERDIQGVLANSFSDRVSSKILDFVKDAEDLDSNELVFGSAVRALDNPCKGFYLLQVSKKLLSLRDDADSEDEDRSRADIAELKSVLSKKIRSKKFALDLKELKEDPLKAGGPSDKFKTKTRIAYDYEGRSDPYHLRSTRYGSDFHDEDIDADASDDELDGNLDDHDQASGVEAGAMEVEGASNAGGGGDGDVEMGEAGPGPSTAAAAAGKVASSESGRGGGDKVDVGGTMQQRTLTAKLGEDQNQQRPRRRRYRAYYNSALDKPEESKKFPENSLPVAAFVLDLFGPNHLCARIFTEHALVNGNARHLSFAIAEGTLVSTRHFKILAKLGRPPLPSLWVALEHQEFYEEEFDDDAEEDEKEIKTRAIESTPQPRLDSTIAASVEPAPMEVDAAPIAPASAASDPPVNVDEQAAPLAPPPPPFPAPSTTTDAASTSTSLAASRPRRSLGKQHYDVDLKEEEDVDEDFEDDASSKSKGRRKVDTKGKGKAVDKKGKGKEVVAPVADKKGKGREVVGKEDKKSLGPYERERLKWIVFLWEMLKAEDATLKLRRKEHKANAVKGKRAEPVKKTAFHKSLVTHFAILCNVDVIERSNANVPAVANYSKLAAANGRASNDAYQSDDSEEDEISEEEEEENDDEIDHDEDERRSTNGREEDEEVDEIVEDDEEEEEDAPTTKVVPSKRKRAAAKPKANQSSSSKSKKPTAASKAKAKPVAATTTARGGKKRKVASSPAPSVASTSKSKAKAKSTSKPKSKPGPEPNATKSKAASTAKSKPKAKTAAKGKGKTTKGRGKGKKVSDDDEEEEVDEIEEDELEEDEEEVMGGAKGVGVGDGESSLSELSDEEDDAAGAGAGVEEMDEGGSGSKAEGGADDSGVFVDDEDGEMVDELAAGEEKEE